MNKTTWEKDSWRKFPIDQQPVWPNKSDLDNVVKNLCLLPALVYAGETRALSNQIAEAGKGNVFILQVGDCVENFNRCVGPQIHNLLKVILQMSTILTYAGEKKIVNIGRIAGQYAKPRSSDFEIFENNKIPSYKGDIVNSHEPVLKERIPDPQRILTGYYQATATLNLIRAFTHGGYASLDQIQDWHKDFYIRKPIAKKYRELVVGINKAIKFTNLVGIDLRQSQLNNILYTSHEALLLEYEEALTRIDTLTGEWYDTSAHMLWIGDRTRQPNGAHVEFLRGVNNPVGIKIGPKYIIDDIKQIIQKINPNNLEGRISLITRFGISQISKKLPKLIKDLRIEGYNITWICDPMHGNTYTNESGKKTRKIDDIINETRMFFEIHNNEGTVPAGVHLEITGEDVTECIGGSSNLSEKDLSKNYQALIDPRLNAEQSVEIAFEIATLITK